jgi:hypothetical protein
MPLMWVTPDACVGSCHAHTVAALPEPCRAATRPWPSRAPAGSPPQHPAGPAAPDRPACMHASCMQSRGDGAQRCMHWPQCPPGVQAAAAQYLDVGQRAVAQQVPQAVDVLGGLRSQRDGFRVPAGRGGVGGRGGCWGAVCGGRMRSDALLGCLCACCRTWRGALLRPATVAGSHALAASLAKCAPRERLLSSAAHVVQLEGPASGGRRRAGSAAPPLPPRPAIQAGVRALSTNAAPHRRVGAIPENQPDARMVLACSPIH